MILIKSNFLFSRIIITWIAKVIKLLNCKLKSHETVSTMFQNHLDNIELCFLMKIELSFFMRTILKRGFIFWH